MDLPHSGPPEMVPGFGNVPPGANPASQAQSIQGLTFGLIQEIIAMHIRQTKGTASLAQREARDVAYDVCRYTNICTSESRGPPVSLLDVIQRDQRATNAPGVPPEPRYATEVDPNGKRRIPSTHLHVRPR